METAMSWLTLVLSVLALVVSVFVAWRQQRVSKQANSLPILVDMFQEWRTEGQKLHREYVYERLREECSPRLGYDDLPTQAKLHVKEVSNFLDNLGLLVYRGIVDEELVIAYLGGSVLELWGVLAPYIREEQKKYWPFQTHFEHLASRCSRKDPKEIWGKLEKMED